MGNTAYYALLFTPTAIIVGAGCSRSLLNHRRLPVRGAFRTALFLPFIVSLAVAAFAWSYLLDPQIGLLNYWLRGFGIQLGNVLQDPALAMPTVALVAVWKNFGFYMVIFLAGLQEIPSSLYEAARVDGATAWQRFRHITLPMLSNTLAFVMIVALIAALQAFDQIYVMTGGGPYGTTQTVVMEIYTSGLPEARARLRLGAFVRAAARHPAAEPRPVPLLRPSRGGRADDRHDPAGGGPTPPARTAPSPQGRRATRIVLFLAALAATALVLLPIAIIAFTAFKPVAEVNAYPPTLLPDAWTLDNFAQIFEELPFARLIVNSFIFAGGVTRSRCCSTRWPPTRLRESTSAGAGASRRDHRQPDDPVPGHADPDLPARQ